MGIIRWSLRWLGLLLLSFVLISVCWVLLYRWLNPPTTWLMVRDWRSDIPVYRTWVPLADIPKAVPYAAIAAEDAQFCSHSGFDVEAIRKAFERNSKGNRLRGGSTISQQTAKNAFLWPQRSWVRKGLEAWFTGLIELLWPKPRIMEVYLNIAEWGKGVYGIDAAARRHFNKEPGKLTRQEAARLAAILPSPLKWSASSPGPFVRRKARRIAKGYNTVDAELSACLK